MERLNHTRPNQTQKTQKFFLLYLELFYYIQVF